MPRKKKEIFGITEPRIWTKPKRKLNEKTSLGYACIEYAENVLQKNLYPWQKWILIHMLEIEGDLEKKWHFRFRTVLILVSRQNGKTVLSEVIASFFLNILQVKNILGTSLSLEKAIEVLEATAEDQENIPELAETIKNIYRANGNNKLVLKNGSVYKIGAPNRRAGRGDSNDLVLLDELRESRNWELWSAAVASTNARPNALTVCFSNAGDPDSIVLRQVRSQAIAEIEKDDSKKKPEFGGEEVEALGLFEWSAEDECETDDIEQLQQANPALGYGRLTLRALMANRSTFPENQFRSECLCQTVESLLPAPFPDGAWENLEDNNSIIYEGADIFYGIDMSVDRRFVSIGACGIREDGNYHIELITKRAGTQWAVDWFRERAAKGEMKLAFQSRGAPICGLAEEICTLPGVTRIGIESYELGASWNRFYDAIAAGTPKKDDKEKEVEGVRIYHLDQPILASLTKTMQLKNFGNGTSLPDRVKSPDDIAPLFACIMAFGAATMITRENENKKVFDSVYTTEYTLAFV